MFDDGETKDSKPVVVSDKAKKKGISEHISKVFASKKKEIDMLHDEIESLQQQKNRTVLDINASISILKSKDKDLEDSIANKKSCIAQLDIEIVQKEDQLKREGENYYEKTKQLDKKTQQVEFHDSRNVEKEKELQDKENRLDSRDSELINKALNLSSEENNLKGKANSLKLERDNFEVERDRFKKKFIEHELELSNAIHKLEKEAKDYQDSIVTQTELDQQRKDIADSIIKLAKDNDEMNSERNRMKNIFKDLQADQNQLNVVRKNLNSRERSLNNRQKEIRNSEAIIAKGGK